MDGVLSEPQVLQPTHGVVASQPAELHVVPVIAPWQGKQSPAQRGTAAGGTGLARATRRSHGSSVSTALSPGRIPCGTRRAFSSGIAVPAQNKMTRWGQLPSTENWFNAKHCVDPVDGQPPEVASLII